MSMTTNKQTLREAAEKAGSDKWQAKKINGDSYVIRNGSYEKQHGITSYQPIAEIEHKPVRDFVAAANPATVLALLDELESAQRRNAEKRTINVKLPADYYSEDGSVNDDMVNTCAVVEAFRDALSAAGIIIAAATDKGE